MFYLIDHSTFTIVEASENFSYLCDVMVDREIMAATISRLDNLFEAFDAFAMLTVYEKLAGVQWRGSLNRDELVKASSELTRLLRPSKRVKPVAFTKEEAPQKPVARAKSVIGATAMVWDIANAHRDFVDNGWPAFRKLVLEKCVEAGINPATAQVQLGKWKHQNF